MSSLTHVVVVGLCVAVAGCGVTECAGGTQVMVVNQTDTELTVEITAAFDVDAGTALRTVAPGESVYLLNETHIGGSALPVGQSISRVRIYAGATEYHDGPISAPAFALEEDRGGGCSYAGYTFTATP